MVNNVMEMIMLLVVTMSGAGVLCSIAITAAVKGTALYWPAVKIGAISALCFVGIAIIAAVKGGALYWPEVMFGAFSTICFAGTVGLIYLAIRPRNENDEKE